MKQIIWNTESVNDALSKINSGFILKRIENPFFQSIVGENFGLRRDGITFEYSDDELSEYTKCALDIQHFAEKYCWIKGDDGEPILIPLRDYQREILDDFQNHRFNILMASRQISKTIMSSITILHFVLFNNVKSCLVAANKLDTATEVIDKIKEMYQRLPFFLQQGIVNWNQKMILLENKSKIKGFATTKNSSIGNTGDFLYLDEFAHLQDTIKSKFYKSIIPTIANIDNSKIIITSTPNGIDLFHKLLIDAEKLEGDPEKNNFHARRIYWYQVPKRFVTYIRLNRQLSLNIKRELLIDDILNEPTDISVEAIFNYLTQKYPQNEIKLTFNKDIKKNVINVFNNDYCSEEDIIKEEINGIKLSSLAEITTWKKETIKDIGSEEAFNQEYDLRFINASRSLLNEAVVDNLIRNKKVYEWEQIYELDQKIKFSYNDLKWIQDDDIFSPISRKDTKVIMSVDVSEGLGQDYSVINIFKICNKDIDIINSQKRSFKSIVDLFKLEQIGIYRSNIISVSQLSEILYLIAFEYFNPDNVKIVLEVNNYGNELLAFLPHVFDGNNNYGSSIFFRYKHKHDALEEKVGLKVGENKNLLVKEYQERMEMKCISITNEINITEITTFIKHTTSAGNIRYAADGSSNDDCVMTIVNVSSIFKKNTFRQIVDEIAEKITDPEIREIINEIEKSTEYTESLDYTQVLNIRKRHINQNRYKNDILNNTNYWLNSQNRLNN